MGIKSADDPTQYGYLNHSILSGTPRYKKTSWQQYIEAIRYT